MKPDNMSPDELLKFNRMVYALVRRIPSGKVLTYGRVAALLEVPNGARAVGWALSQLPNGTDVPWQRVINAQGKISLRAFGNSTLLQRELLEKEGVKFDEKESVKLEGPDGIMWEPSPWEVREIIDTERDNPSE